MTSKFLHNKAGNFGIIAGLAALPLTLLVGLALDGSRWYAAQADLQDAADTTSLALAASAELDLVKLRASGDRFLSANLLGKSVTDAVITDLQADKNSVKLRVHGNIRATFMKLANFDTLSSTAFVEARRSPGGNIEVALVLDNTFSMSKSAGNGQTKLAALKTAAKSLVDVLLPSPDGTVKIGVVPYADYVSVGLSNRKQSWMSVPDDYSTTSASNYKEVKEETTCPDKKYEPKYSCTYEADGMTQKDVCGGECSRPVTVYYDPPKQVPLDPETDYVKWFGCVRSRTTGNDRLNDLFPSRPYTGRMDTEQPSGKKCPQDILPLTTDVAKLTNTIKDMYYELDYYQPSTYIPAGLIWGQNVLSPTVPFDEGSAYDTANRMPRKIMILMTDGDNTQMFRPSDGDHEDITGEDVNKSWRAAERAQTDADSVAICNYSKSKGIEIYTIGFAIPASDTKSRDLLRKCATDDQHFIDVDNGNRLIAEFTGIATALSQVRLAQ